MAKLFVCKGAICKCSLQTTPGILEVTSQTNKKLEGKLQATEDDKTFSMPFGACKRSSPPPPCTPNLSKWTNVADTTKVDGKLALLEDSKNTCSFGGAIEITNPSQTIGKTAELPTNEILHSFKGEVHFRRKLEPSGNYALYPNGFSDITQNQVYGFDWIRDVLDGEEDYFKQQIPDPRRQKQIVNFTGEIMSPIIGSFENTITIRLGKYIHFMDLDAPTRKIKSENLVFLSQTIYVITGTYVGSKSDNVFYAEAIEAANGQPSTVTVTNLVTNNSGEILEYDKNRSLANTYDSTNPNYGRLLGNVGGSYAAGQSSILLTPFNDLAKEHVPIKQYINTPNGTDRVGNNAGRMTLTLNKKNYYVPWFAAFKTDTSKIQALFFPDVLPPAGEIKFEASDSNIQIKPNKVAVSTLNVHTYPIATQAADTVPASNKLELEITFTDAIVDDEVIEARYYDDKKKSNPNYKGELIGLLNVLKNEKEYELTFRYLKVYFTDDNGWLKTAVGSNDNKLPTGPGLPAAMAARAGSGSQSKIDQLTRGQNSIDLFLPAGSQDPYLKNIFKQGLIYYKPPIIISDNDAVAIDISEIFTRAEVRSGSGVVFSADNIVFPSDELANRFTNSIQQLAKNKINASKGNHDGVTLALMPYTFNNLFGVSDGIGGGAKNVFVTYLKYKNIASDRATASHEALHSLGLYHSFVDGGELPTYIIPKNDALTKLMHLNTENVMDYTSTARTIYKWQWEKVQNDLPDVKPKP